MNLGLTDELKISAVFLQAVQSRVNFQSSEARSTRMATCVTYYYKTRDDRFKATPIYREGDLEFDALLQHSSSKSTQSWKAAVRTPRKTRTAIRTRVCQFALLVLVPGHRQQDLQPYMLLAFISASLSRIPRATSHVNCRRSLGPH